MHLVRPSIKVSFFATQQDKIIIKRPGEFYSKTGSIALFKSFENALQNKASTGQASNDQSFLSVHSLLKIFTQ